MPSATPKRKGRGAEPSATRRAIKTLDSKGRQTVSLAPRVLGKADQPPHFGLLNAQRTADAGSI
jgi:hypothetical protein